MKKPYSLLAIALLCIFSSLAEAQTPTQTATIKLSWQDNSDNEKGFEIERSLGGEASFAAVAKVGANVVNHDDVITGDPGNTQYCYRVRAFNDAGTSGYTNTACATTPAIEVPPNAPSGLGITVTIKLEITVTP
jgi:titin